MPNAQEPQANHHQLLLVTIFSLAMIILLVAAIVLIAPEIEKDLKQKITTQLEKNDITASVNLSGRDVVLSGIVNATDIQKAQISIAKIDGLHFIDSQPTPIAATHPEKHPPPFEKKTILSVNNTKHTENTNTEDESTQTASQISTQAYEKILAAMSRYNENKNQLAKTSINNNKPSNTLPFDFDTSTIRFKKNSSKLIPKTKKMLNNLANKLKKSAKIIEITVNAKKSDLAFKQAKKIQQYLITKGIKKKRLIIIGTSNDTKNTITIMEQTISSP